MKLTEFNALLFEIEEKFPVQDWSYDGMDIWPIIRCSFKPQAFADNTPAKFKIVKSALLRLSYSLYYSLKTAFKPDRQADVLFISTSVNYRFAHQGQLFDYYLDPIKTEFLAEGYSCATVGIYCEDIFKSLPADIKFNDILRYAMALAPFKQELLHTPQLDAFNDFCQAKGLAFNWPTIKKRLAAESRYTSIFQRQLRKISPKLIFVSCYAGKWGMIRAAKREGIPFVDVQHGVQGPWHYEYNQWKNLHNTLPDIFWNWTKADKQRIESWNGTAFLGGHPLFRAMSKKLLSFSEANDAKQGVLISLQTGFPWEYIKPLLEGSEQQFYIRFHPATPRHEYEEITAYLSSLKKDTIDYVWASKSPIPVVLEHSFVHVTLSSSIVIEAAMLGLPSVCLHPDAREMYKDYIAAGLVVMCEDEDRVLDAINKLKEVEKGDALSETSESLDELWGHCKH